MNLNNRELSAVIAALEYRIDNYGYYDDALQDIDTNGGQHKPMSPDEIQALIEKINFGPEVPNYGIVPEKLCCPECGYEDMDGGPAIIDGMWSHQACTCNRCGSGFVNRYRMSYQEVFVSTIPNNAPNPYKEETE